MGRVIASSMSSNSNKVLPWSTTQEPVMRAPSNRSSTSILGMKMQSPVTTILKIRWSTLVSTSFFMGTDIADIVEIIKSTYHRRHKVSR